MISNRNKWHILKILPFGIIMLLFGFLYVFIERGLLGTSNLYPATNNPYEFTYALTIVLPGAFLLGLVIGVLEEFYFESKLNKYSLGIKLLIKNGIYLGMIISFMIILALFANAHGLNRPFYDVEVLSLVWQFITAFAFWSIVLYSAFNITIALYYSETQTGLGQKMFANFFLGKYHRPVQERRIFMFLDMKSSTTIAERMGHVRYYDLLNDYYDTMTDAIIDSNGEIYQYVGDEVIITWEEEDGIKLNQCIECFKSIKNAFQMRAEYFRQSYGLVPQFKAGIHTGQVTSGEIGTLKKEIIYTGDVLNTAARIQGLCNDYEADLLISLTLFELLNLSNYSHKEIGSLMLKGKETTMAIVKIIV